MVTDKQVEAALRQMFAGNEFLDSPHMLKLSAAERMRAALIAAEAAAWEPIESAPHNQQVLLYCPDRGCPTNPERIELGYASFGYGSKSHHSWATHWRLLPQPPKETT